MINANYGVDVGSVTVHRIEPDGRLGDMTDHVEHAGSGPDPVRQANSHVHMIASDPVTGDILVSDLGSDTVFVYALDPTAASPPRLPPTWRPSPARGRGTSPSTRTAATCSSSTSSTAPSARCAAMMTISR